MRTDRYNQWIGDDLLSNAHVGVVGVGALGYGVVRLLAQAGIGRITAYDFDTVEEHNMGSQGYKPKDLGRPKVRAAERELSEINPECAFQGIEERYGSEFNRDVEGVDVLVLAPDCMDVRYYGHGKFLEGDYKTVVDGRMVAFAGDVYATQDPEWYGRTLYPNEAATEQDECSARTTPQCAGMMSSLMAHWVLYAIKRGKKGMGNQHQYLNVGMGTCFSQIEQASTQVQQEEVIV